MIDKDIFCEKTSKYDLKAVKQLENGNLLSCYYKNKREVYNENGIKKNNLLCWLENGKFAMVIDLHVSKFGNIWWDPLKDKKIYTDDPEKIDNYLKLQQSIIKSLLKV